VRRDGSLSWRCVARPPLPAHSVAANRPPAQAWGGRCAPVWFGVGSARSAAGHADSLGNHPADSFRRSTVLMMADEVHATHPTSCRQCSVCLPMKSSGNSEHILDVLVAGGPLYCALWVQTGSSPVWARIQCTLYLYGPAKPALAPSLPSWARCCHGGGPLSLRAAAGCGCGGPVPALRGWGPVRGCAGNHFGDAGAGRSPKGCRAASAP
jgi:hypothetical protein